MDKTKDTALLGLELHAEVWLGVEQVPLERLMELQTGSVLPLSQDPEGPVDLVVNGTRVARGQLVVVDGRFGFRVSAADDASLADATGGEQPAAEAPIDAVDAVDASETPPLPPEPDGIDKPARDKPAKGESDED